eukprot:5133640-Prymnesium_polylepis.1
MQPFSNLPLRSDVLPPASLRDALDAVGGQRKSLRGSSVGGQLEAWGVSPSPGEVFSHGQAASGRARFGSTPPHGWWRRYVRLGIAPTMPASASYHLVQADASGLLQYLSTRTERRLLDIPLGRFSEAIEAAPTAHRLICQGVSGRASAMLFDAPPLGCPPVVRG